MAVERLNAIINEELLLRAEFRLYHTNELFDPFEIQKVEIIDTDQVSVLETILPPNITQDSLGNYHVTTDVTWNTEAKNVYDKWYYIPTNGATLVTLLQGVFIDEIFPVQEDFRKGFAFNNHVRLKVTIDLLCHFMRVIFASSRVVPL